MKGILDYGAEKFVDCRIELEDLAMQALTYVLHPAFKMEDLTKVDRHSLSDDYKRTVSCSKREPRDLPILGVGGDVFFSID